MSKESVFDMICDKYQLHGGEKLLAYNHYKEGGENSLIAHLAEIGNLMFVDEQFNHVLAISETRQNVFDLLGKESAQKAASIIKRRLFLGGNKREGD